MPGPISARVVNYSMWNESNSKNKENTVSKGVSCLSILADYSPVVCVTSKKYVLKYPHAEPSINEIGQKLVFKPFSLLSTMVIKTRQFKVHVFFVANRLTIFSKTYEVFKGAIKKQNYGVH